MPRFECVGGPLDGKAMPFSTLKEVCDEKGRIVDGHIAIIEVEVDKNNGQTYSVYEYCKHDKKWYYKGVWRGIMPSKNKS